MLTISTHTGGEKGHMLFMDGMLVANMTTQSLNEATGLPVQVLPPNVLN
jgi:hypothetical protein